MANGNFSDLVTNPLMKKVLFDTNHMCYTQPSKNYNNKNMWRVVRGSGATDMKPSPTGKCTNGPATWYRNAGIPVFFWNSASSATVDEMKRNLTKAGFQMIWSGTGQQANTQLASLGILRPGDVATMLSSNSAHAAMWTGQDWRSDFVQNNPYPYSSVGRGGNETFILWRHPQLQDEGTQQVTQQNTPQSTSQNNRSGKPKAVYIWKNYPAWGQMYTDANALMRDYRVNTSIVDQIIRACIANGLSLNKTAVILANGFQESHFNPKAHNDISGGHDGVWQFSTSQYKRFGLSNWNTQLQYLMEEVAPTKDESVYNKTVYNKKSGRYVPITMWGIHNGGNGWTIKYKRIWDHSDDLDQLSKAFGEGWERYGYASVDTESRTQLARIFRDYLLNSDYAFNSGQPGDNKPTQQQDYAQAPPQTNENLGRLTEEQLLEGLFVPSDNSAIDADDYTSSKSSYNDDYLPTLDEILGRGYGSSDIEGVGEDVDYNDGFKVKNNEKTKYVDYYAIVSDFLQRNPLKHQSGGQIGNLYENSIYGKDLFKPATVDYYGIIKKVWGKDQGSGNIFTDGKYPDDYPFQSMEETDPSSYTGNMFQLDPLSRGEDVTSVTPSPSTPNNPVQVSKPVQENNNNSDNQIVYSQNLDGQVRNHVVQDGEDFGSIAARYNMYPNDLLSLNGLNSTQIQPGQVLKVRGTPLDDPRGPAYNGNAGTVKLQDLPQRSRPEIYYTDEDLAFDENDRPQLTNTYYDKYVVQAGENLTDILANYQMDYDDFKEFNHLESDDLQEGQVLNITNRKKLEGLYPFSRPIYNTQAIDNLMGTNLISLSSNNGVYDFSNLSQDDIYLLRDVGDYVADKWQILKNAGYDKKEDGNNDVDNALIGLDNDFSEILSEFYISDQNKFDKQTPLEFYYRNKDKYPMITEIQKDMRNKGYDGLQILLFTHYLLKNKGENIPEMSSVLAFRLSEQVRKLWDDYNAYYGSDVDVKDDEEVTIPINPIEPSGVVQNDPSAIKADDQTGLFTQVNQPTSQPASQPVSTQAFYIPEYLTKNINFEDDKQVKNINQNDVLTSFMYYVPIINQEFNGKNLPDIFKYIPLLQSSNPKYVNLGRAGLWNLEIYQSKGDGLDVNTLVDERLDPYKSTQVAAKYLQKLYDIYKDTDIVLATFLTNIPTINKAISRSGVDDNHVTYDAIKHLLPKDIQKKIEQLHTMYENAKGITDQDNLGYTYPYTSTVTVDQRLNLNQISDVLGIPYETLQALNPWFRNNGDIPGTYRPQKIVLPQEYVQQFNERLTEIVNYNTDQYHRLVEVEPGSKDGGQGRVYSQPAVQQQEVQQPVQPAVQPQVQVVQPAVKPQVSVEQLEQEPNVTTYYQAPNNLQKNASFIVISKKDQNLCVYGKTNDGQTVLLARYPVALSANRGQKQRKGDRRTPSSTQQKPFYISSIENSSTWKHNFNDGRGNILAYGNWFLRLHTPGFTGIGIHGSTNNENSVPGRASDGCIRLLDRDIQDLKDKFAYVNMPVYIKDEDEGIWDWEINIRGNAVPLNGEQSVVQQQQVVQNNAEIPSQYQVKNQNDLTKIDNLLQDGMTEYSRGGVSPNDLVLFYANELRNAPYVAHTLEGNQEKLTIEASRFDCTTFVEALYALVKTTLDGNDSWQDYAHNLEDIRYRDGKMVDYASRLHYISDWINDNVRRGNIIDVAAQRGQDYVVQSINKPLYYMTVNRGSYPQLSDQTQFNKIQQIEQGLRNNQFFYIKKDFIDSDHVRSFVKPGDFVAFVTTTNGLDVSHLGVVDYDSRGKLVLIDASSVQGRVVRESKDLYTMLKDRKSVLGIRVFRINQ